MKAKDLNYPYPKGHPAPFIHENILVIPQWKLERGDFLFPFWESVFANQPSLELCSGNGDWILEQAQKSPEKQWIAVEMRYDRVAKIWSKCHNLGIKNLWIVHGKAQDFIENFLSDACVFEVFVHFPDPWPKKKHHKNRLFQPNFIAQLQRVLVESGRLKVVSDDLPYLEDSYANLEKFVELTSPRGIERLETYAFSFFKELWESKGRNLYSIEFYKEKSHVEVS